MTQRLWADTQEAVKFADRVCQTDLYPLGGGAFFPMKLTKKVNLKK